ncbi:MAG: hypothetical protein WB565_17135 [Acidimicrobiales bacterium]
MSGRSTYRTDLGKLAVGVAVGSLVILAAAVLALSGPREASAAASGPVPLITPAPVGGAFVNGQVVTIAVGPNSTFAPYSRIVIIECAAPGGVLPLNDSACDGNTVQYGSVLVKPDGSFEARAYRFYQLPDRQLSETPSSLPACNATTECVLYIGQDQNDFTQPKTFSAAYTVAPSAGPAPSGEPAALGSGKVGSATAGGATSGASTPAHGGSTAATPPAASVGGPSSPVTPPPVASARRDPTSATQGGFAPGGLGVLLWLVIAAVLLALLAIGGLRLRRRIAP